ncbi:MAG: chemotaxis protein CheB, partial [Burkholderiales bacterium]|nr:chemotaxis protein CheB [Burkholderiales bacterium]
MGASAGGLEPLVQFLAAVPAASGLAYVVVQHMDPTHAALLGTLLQRATALPVCEATDGQPVEPDAVYVIPPNAELTVLRGRLRLLAPAQPRGQRLPIDLLFSSLAREFGDRAIGVVLSGMGSDGSRGLQSIKVQGGLTLAQQPDTAQFDSMPASAIAAGGVDIVAPAAELPRRILQALGQQRSTQLDGDAAAGHAPAVLAAILGLLQAHARHDLSSYKSNTLVRRITRRMAVHGLDTMDAYAEHLRHNAQELDLLFKEVLIGVTSFLRDAPVWQELQASVLPPLLARHAARQGPLRAWVIGCSTGEEAYSLAILLAEALEAQALPGTAVQIFASDLNPDAIALARSGRFAASIARDLTPQRLARYFTEQPGGYLIDKRIREMVLFAQHDVILDPPFTRLDILCCRNLLIYFDAALQRRLVPLFHYSLRPGGALLLGGSETVGRAQALFTPLHPKSRLYWRSDHGDGVGSVHFPTHRRPASRSALPETTVPPLNPPPANLQSLVDHLLLESYAPPAVLVNEAGDIVHVSGRTGRFLEPSAGKANGNIHAMARPALRAQLALALRSAVHDKTAVELRGLRLEDDAQAVVDITVQAIAQPRAIEGMVLIVFREAPPAPRSPQASHARRGRA